VSARAAEAWAGLGASFAPYHSHASGASGGGGGGGGYSAVTHATTIISVRKDGEVRLLVGAGPAAAASEAPPSSPAFAPHQESPTLLPRPPHAQSTTRTQPPHPAPTPTQPRPPSAPNQVVVMGDGQATQDAFVVKANVTKVRRIGPGVIGGFAGRAADGLSLLERLEGKLEEHPGQVRGQGRAQGRGRPETRLEQRAAAGEGALSPWGMRPRGAGKVPANPQRWRPPTSAPAPAPAPAPPNPQLQRAAVELAKDWRQDRVLRNLEVRRARRGTRAWEEGAAGPAGRSVGRGEAARALPVLSSWAAALGGQGPVCTAPPSPPHAPGLSRTTHRRCCSWRTRIRRCG
jgi:ATP-dependent protease HslVU (ClpYQ) peptidase subunit